MGRHLKSNPGLVERLAQLLAACRRSAAGNVTIEFGFLIPLLVMLALGTFDFGRLGLQKIVVSNAARAGTQYGSQGFSEAHDTDGQELAARLDAGVDEGVLDIDPSPPFCTCPVDGNAVVSCSETCSDGSFTVLYVEVTVSDEIDLMFPYPGISSPHTISSTSTVRVR